MQICTSSVRHSSVMARVSVVLLMPAN